MNAKTYGAYIVFLALLIKNGPLPTELKFKETPHFRTFFRKILHSAIFSSVSWIPLLFPKTMK